MMQQTWDILATYASVCHTFWHQKAHKQWKVTW